MKEHRQSNSLGHTQLHWSFDYTRFNGAGFDTELTATLGAVYAGGPPSNVAVTSYSVLPNFWGGYNWGAGDGAALAFGTASITRTPNDAGIDYHIDYYHDASGERLVLDFLTDTAPLRQLTGDWRIHVTNSAADEYNGLDAIGTVTDSGAIRVTTRGIPFVEEQRPADRPLLCNWTLFDVIPELAKLPVETEFALLEDLEKLKPQCRIAPQDTYDLHIGDIDLELRCFVVFGEAQVPLRFWLDADDNVAIATNIFNTFVLSNTGPSQ